MVEGRRGFHQLSAQALIACLCLGQCRRLLSSSTAPPAVWLQGRPKHTSKGARWHAHHSQVPKVPALTSVQYVSAHAHYSPTTMPVTASQLTCTPYVGVVSSHEQRPAAATNAPCTAGQQTGARLFPQRLQLRKLCARLPRLCNLLLHRCQLHPRGPQLAPLRRSTHAHQNSGSCVQPGLLSGLSF